MASGPRNPALKWWLPALMHILSWVSVCRAQPTSNSETSLAAQPPNLTSGAEAQPQPARVASEGGETLIESALTVHSSSGCPSQATLETELQQRAPRLRLVREHPSALLVEVSLSQSSSTTANAEVHIWLNGELRDKREFHGNTCSEVARAATLSVAFALESISLIQPTTPAAEASSAEREPEPAPRKYPAKVGSHSSATLGVGVAMTAVHVLEQQWLLGGTLWGALRRQDTLKSELTLGILAATNQLHDANSSSFSLLSGDLHLCPISVGSTFRVTACAQSVFGAMLARGADIESPLSVTRTWLSIGPSVRLFAPLTQDTCWVASLGPSFPVTRRSFIFEEPAQVIAKSASVGWLLSVGIAHTVGEL